MDRHSSQAARYADFGILGTGRMGVRLAVMLAAAGRRVVLGSRNPQRAARIAARLGIAQLQGGSYAQALQARFVLPAIFIRDGLFDLLAGFRRELDGKVLVDITNPFNDDYSDFITGWDTSGAEELQKILPRTRIVGAFKNFYWEVFDSPLFDGKPSDILVVGDDAAAKQEFLALTAATPFRYLDAGPLRNARTVERMTLLAGSLGRSLGASPRIGWRLLGDPWKPGSADRRGIDALIAR
jgi:predicted dinucleotide-binding enzyme